MAGFICKLTQEVFEKWKVTKQLLMQQVTSTLAQFRLEAPTTIYDIFVTHEMNILDYFHDSRNEHSRYVVKAK